MKKPSFKEYMKGSQAPPKELKKILPFLGFILVIFGFAHNFAYIIAARNLYHPIGLNLFRVTMFIGLFLMPVGFVSSWSHSSKLLWLSWAGYIWMGFFTILGFFCTIEFCLYLFIGHSYSYWVIIVSIAISLFSLYKGLIPPLLVNHKLRHDKLKGLKLVQISDLHIGMLNLNEHWLKKIVDRVNALKPDVLVITGDLVEGEFNEIVEKLQVLKELLPNMLKYYTTGNHEYINGSGPWEEALTSLGFKALHNTNDIIDFNGAKVLMAGVPDRMIRHFIKNKRSRPDEALKTDQTVDYRILLAHQATSIRDLKKEKCDLMLCGHTHGGQIFPFHLFVRFVQPIVSGFRTIKNVKIFVHQGTGYWGPPMRWFSQSEIVVFDWE